MKISKKQELEIDFLCSKYGNFTPTQEEKEEYVNITVNGVGSKGKMTENRIFQQKRLLDIDIKGWRKEIMEEKFIMALGFIDQLREDPELKHPYLDKIILTIVKNLDKNE